MSNVQLYLGDCLEFMKSMPDKSVDAVITDPPYGISFVSSWTKRKAAIVNDGLEEWMDLMQRWLPETKRVLSDTGCCCCCCGGGKTPVTAMLTIEAIKHFYLVQTLVWKKFIGLGWRYRPAYENILVLSKSKDDYAFYDTSKSLSNVIEGVNQDIPNSEQHPTQKPPGLMARLILTHTREGDTVFDPFMGSGTTGVACVQTGRNFIGCEISKEYYEIAAKRIADAQLQMRLPLP